MPPHYYTLTGVGPSPAAWTATPLAQRVPLPVALGAAFPVAPTHHAAPCAQRYPAGPDVARRCRDARRASFLARRIAASAPPSAPADAAAATRSAPVQRKGVPKGVSPGSSRVDPSRVDLARVAAEEARVASAAAAAAVVRVLHPSSAPAPAVPLPVPGNVVSSKPTTVASAGASSDQPVEISQSRPAPAPGANTILPKPRQAPPAAPATLNQSLANGIGRAESPCVTSATNGVLQTRAPVTLSPSRAQTNETAPPPMKSTPSPQKSKPLAAMMPPRKAVSLPDLDFLLKAAPLPKSAPPKKRPAPTKAPARLVRTMPPASKTTTPATQVGPPPNAAPLSTKAAPLPTETPPTQAAPSTRAASQSARAMPPSTEAAPATQAASPPAKSAPSPTKSAPSLTKSAPSPAKLAPSRAKPAPQPTKSAPQPTKSVPPPTMTKPLTQTALHTKAAAPPAKACPLPSATPTPAQTAGGKRREGAALVKGPAAAASAPARAARALAEPGSVLSGTAVVPSERRHGASREGHRSTPAAVAPQVRAPTAKLASPVKPAVIDLQPHASVMLNVPKAAQAAREPTPSGAPRQGGGSPSQPAEGLKRLEADGASQARLPSSLSGPGWATAAIADDAHSAPTAPASGADGSAGTTPVASAEKPSLNAKGLRPARGASHENRDPLAAPAHAISDGSGSLARKLNSDFLQMFVSQYTAVVLAPRDSKDVGAAAAGYASRAKPKVLAALRERINSLQGRSVEESAELRPGAALTHAGAGATAASAARRGLEEGKNVATPLIKADGGNGLGVKGQIPRLAGVTSIRELVKSWRAEEAESAHAETKGSLASRKALLSKIEASSDSILAVLQSLGATAHLPAEIPEQDIFLHMMDLHSMDAAIALLMKIASEVWPGPEGERAVAVSLRALQAVMSWITVLTSRLTGLANAVDQLAIDHSRREWLRDNMSKFLRGLKSANGGGIAATLKLFKALAGRRVRDGPWSSLAMKQLWDEVHQQISSLLSSLGKLVSAGIKSAPASPVAEVKHLGALPAPAATRAEPGSGGLTVRSAVLALPGGQAPGEAGASATAAANEKRDEGLTSPRLASKSLPSSGVKSPPLRTGDLKRKRPSNAAVEPSKSSLGSVRIPRRSKLQDEGQGGKGSSPAGLQMDSEPVGPKLDGRSAALKAASRRDPPGGDSTPAVKRMRGPAPAAGKGNLPESEAAEVLLVAPEERRKRRNGRPRQKVKWAAPDKLVRDMAHEKDCVVSSYSASDLQSIVNDGRDVLDASHSELQAAAVNERVMEMTRGGLYNTYAFLRTYVQAKVQVAHNGGLAPSPEVVEVPYVPALLEEIRALV